MLKYFPWGGGCLDCLVNYSTTVAKKQKVIENAVTTSLATWLTVDQLSCNFDSIGGMMPLHPKLAQP